MRPVEIAFAGCGSFARLMAHVYSSVRGIRIVACYDPDEGAAYRFARRHHVPHVAPSYPELIRCGAEAVYLPVPHALHVPYAREAVEAGLHVLVEKPLSLTAADGRELVELAARRERVLAVNFHNRFNVDCKRLIARSVSGAMGRPVFTSVLVPWRRPASYAPASSWRASRELAGGGTLITQAIHALDVALRAQQAPVVSVSALLSRMQFVENETEDTAACQIGMGDGSVIQLASTMAAGHERPATVEIVSTAGREKVRLASGAGFLLSCRRSMYAFAQSVRTGQAPASAAADCLGVTQLVETLYRAADLGETVHLHGETV